jgi:pyruvate formate lyase activating enzyme
MNSKQAVVNKILTFSCVDGPGNRLVIFFHGCNFKCQACHNPYTMSFCNDCGDCIEVCTEGALTLDGKGKIQWHSDRCTQCDKCLDICPISASPMTSRYSAAELIEVIRENQPFISGITLSGGEATIQLPFILDFLSALRADPDLHKLNCLLDTNGSLGASGWNKLLPYIDGVMLDLKSWHSDRHRMLTGAGNSKVIKSLSLLAASNKLVEVRLLVIPERTDFDDYLDTLCNTLRELPAETTIRINAFHHHGVKGIAKTWPNATQGQIEAFAHQLEGVGISNLVLPTVYFDKLEASGPG